MIELTIDGRERSLGDVSVRRVLPSPRRRMVGPFIFVDHMGPMALAPGAGMDVRPHPHINLATVTYLFEGEILHRDNLGSDQVIRPGAVNWMTAGRGIAHSERSPAAARAAGPRLHGLQLWVALPTASEEDAPTFQHHPSDTIPAPEQPGARLRVVAGSAYGQTSPVRVASPLFYVDAELDAGAELALPGGFAGRAAYVVDGQVEHEEGRFGEGTMIIFAAGGEAAVRALGPARVMLLGGDALDGPRHIWWNFVSSSKERIEQAKRDWRERRFAPIPGDDGERIPLPED